MTRARRSAPRPAPGVLSLADLTAMGATPEGRARRARLILEGSADELTARLIAAMASLQLPLRHLAVVLSYPHPPDDSGRIEVAPRMRVAEMAERFSRMIDPQPGRVVDARRVIEAGEPPDGRVWVVVGWNRVPSDLAVLAWDAPDVPDRHAIGDA